MKTIDEYKITGEHGRMKVAVTTNTYDSAIRAGKAILSVFPECGTVAVKNHKGELIKVVRKE